MQYISNQDFLKKYEAGNLQVVDVRGLDEFASGHLKGAINIPLDQIEQGKIPGINLQKAIYLICLSGNRSEIAAQKLSALSSAGVFSVTGGVKACQSHPGFIKLSRSVLPLMRQVQIVAGSLVLLGVILSMVLHPYFIGLSAFVGAGLVFAGVSGFCGMMKILSCLPWNKNTITCQEDK